MRVKDAPLGFVTGGTISPRVVNENLAELAAAVNDVAAQRFVHFKLRLPYHKSLAAGYSDADSTALREYIINLPYRWSTERAYLRFYGLGAGDVRIDVYEDETLWEGEYLEVTPTGDSESHSDFNGERLEHAMGTDYRFRIDGDSTFTSSWTFLELHIRVDRFNLVGEDFAPAVTPARFSSSDARDAVALNAALAALTTATGTLDPSTFVKAELFVTHSVPAAGTRLWPLPAVDSDVTRRNVIGVRAYQVQNGAPSGATGGTWTLKDAAGVQQDQRTLEAAPTSDEDTADVDLNIAGAGVEHGAAANDWSLEFAHVGSDTVDKTYCLLLYS